MERRVVAAALVAVVVVGCAALEGPTRFSPPFVLGPVGEGQQAAPSATPSASAARRFIGGYTDLHWVVVVAVVLAIVTVVVLLLLPLRAFLARARRERVSLEAPAAPIVGEARTAADDELDPEVVQRGIKAAIDSWAGSRDPADAVVRAWLALQQTADDAGVGRSPAETPSEFAVRVLARTAADRAAVGELLRLYLAARFGSVTVTAAESERARTALLAIERSWGSVPVR